MWRFPLFPDQASSHAADVDAVYFGGLAVLVFFTTLICAIVVTFMIRYRRGNRVNRSNPPRTSIKIEAVWIGFPLLIAIGMFTWAAVVYHRLYDPPPDAYVVDVVGKQWMFYVQHPEGKREINQLHVPIGRPVRLRMISQDVIHSFYVPAFRIKQDLLPGRYTSLWFEPTRIGEYHLFCAEYCGSDHSKMGGMVSVLEPSAYERWLERGSSGISLAKEGEALFQKHHCGGCHGGSQAVRAPMLQGVYGSQVPIMGRDKEVSFVTADDRYIRDSILLPKRDVVAGYEPLMPSYQGQLSEEDLLKIIAYLKSIGQGSGSEANR
jgi:cytochrome c oxidase subunit 2